MQVLAEFTERENKLSKDLSESLAHRFKNSEGQSQEEYENAIQEAHIFYGRQRALNESTMFENIRCLKEKNKGSTCQKIR